MIFYKEDSAYGAFNRFMASRHLEDVADFIKDKASEHTSEWGLPLTDNGNIIPGFIRLAASRDLYVSGDTLYFCCTFDFGFLSDPDESTDDAYSTAFDVIGKILFHPPGTKKYDITFTDVYLHYECPNSDKNHIPRFPGVRVNQALYPAFGYNEEQRHKMLEKEAERFLAQYCPETPQTVCRIPLRRIAEDKMGLQVFTGYRLPEDADALGLTIFRTERISVADEDTGEQIIRRFPRGSIVIDSDTFWERGLGNFNFTLAHEMYHWFAHRVHMAFIDIIGKPDDYWKAKGHLESQADGVGARILMPGKAVDQKDREELDRLASDGLDENTDADAYEMAVASCALFFGASKKAMKKRLQELNLHVEIREPTVRVRLDIVEMFSQYATDETFRELLDAGLYRYLKGYVVRNDPEYIQDDRLTDYAKQHLSECILTFREERRRTDENGDSLLFRKDAYFDRRADYDMRMKENTTLMQMLAGRLQKQKELYISSLEKAESFSEFMLPIISEANSKIMGLDIRDEVDDGFDEGKLMLSSDKRYKSRYFLHYDFQTGKTIRITEPEVFQNKTMVGYKMFEQMRRNDWNNPDLSLVIAVCAGYHLDMATTEKALLCAGYVLIPHVATHLVYRFLISHCRDQYNDTATFNTLLILLGEKEVGTNKKKK